MKKVLKIVLSSCALFALISCTNEKISSEQGKTSEPFSSSEIVLPSSSSSEESSSSSSQPIEVYYHVTFLNYDETILYEVDVLEGNEAVYEGEAPTKPEDDEFTYEFEGWDKDLTNIQANMTTVAQYKSVGKEGWGPIIWF